MSVVLMTTIAKWFDKNVGKALGVMTCSFGAGWTDYLYNIWLIDVF